MPSKEEYFSPKTKSQSNGHWLPWIQKQLILNGILAQTPEMPEPYKPDYDKWCSVFECFKINEDTKLIGHSCGAGFLLRWLSELNVSVGKVVLVAPWINSNRKYDITMFDNLKIDQNLASKTKGVTIFSSSNDDQDVMDSVEVLKNTLKDVRILELKNYGHFCFKDMKTDVFPELLEEIVK